MLAAEKYAIVQNGVTVIGQIGLTLDRIRYYKLVVKMGAQYLSVIMPGRW